MLNIVWLAILLVSVIFGVINGKTHDVVVAITDSAKLAFDIALSMTGIMVLWLGLMRIAEDSGLVQAMTRFLMPLLRVLFPGIPKDHPALGAISLNIVANMLGLANAATPLGLKAMQELAKINKHSNTASNDMCMFLTINTSSVQLIPASAISFLAAAGSSDPGAIIFPGLLATLTSTFIGIIAAKIMSKKKIFNEGLQYDS